ncbi:MAG: hypothetical protein QMD36_04480 [Candidatus Aenigmarchaeota archaeon]|nr:hypothetical protein [Candidatus Aenigmarchaeota archaeon]
MAAEPEMSEEEYSRGYKQSKELAESLKKDQKWIYYLIAGSFGLIVILNYLFPSVYWTEKRPVYNVKGGLIGLILTFFGVIILMSMLCIVKGGSLLIWVVLIALSIALIYFGLPLLWLS